MSHKCTVKALKPFTTETNNLYSRQISSCKSYISVMHRLELLIKIYTLN